MMQRQCVLWLTLLGLLAPSVQAEQSEQMAQRAALNSRLSGWPSN